MRVRHRMTATSFCTEDQIQAGVTAFTAPPQKVYADFALTNILYRLSTRPEKRIGKDEDWGQGETLWPKACVRRAASLNICRVRVLSTVPRSNTP